MALNLFDYQLEAIKRIRNGSILCGGVGSGKSLTALGYYYLKQDGDISFLMGGDYFPMGDPPQDLYIITTARKRDDKEWEGELSKFLLSTNPEVSLYSNKVVVDSWNNIKRYENVEDAFFIFDEQRVIGYGTWSKTFIKIARKNRWILLSATPGDKWEDYMAVFIANGFYKNKTDFEYRHIIYNPRVKFPQVDRYLNIERLIELRERILVNMDFKRKTTSHHEQVYTRYNVELYKDTMKNRWNYFTNKPIRNASELCQLLRRIVITDESRKIALLRIFEKHSRLIIFYNFNYELDILKELFIELGVDVAEWNGHLHQPIPNSKTWVYLVQYNSGCEGWNCIVTDTIVFYSENYSYKIMEQAAGRIDRLTTPYRDLYYYHLKSRARIDLAIDRALRNKKNFNEGRFVNWSSRK